MFHTPIWCSHIYSLFILTAIGCCSWTSWRSAGFPPVRWLCRRCVSSGHPRPARPSSGPPRRRPTGTRGSESAWWWGSRKCHTVTSPSLFEELERQGKGTHMGLKILLLIRMGSFFPRKTKPVWPYSTDWGWVRWMTRGKGLELITFKLKMTFQLPS